MVLMCSTWMRCCFTCLFTIWCFTCLFTINIQNSRICKSSTDLAQHKQTECPGLDSTDIDLSPWEKDNECGYRGVTRNGNMFTAKINTPQNESGYLGRYNSIEAAAKAYAREHLRRYGAALLQHQQVQQASARPSAKVDKEDNKKVDDMVCVDRAPDLVMASSGVCSV